MKKGLLLGCLAACTLITSCGGSKGGSVSLDEATKDFASSVTGTVKFTFTSDYKVDVISEKGGMDNFKQDLDETTVGEVDFTAGNLYLHIKKEGTDQYKEEGKKYMSEALVAKNETGYFFLTNTMENEKALASEAEAMSKIEELLTKVSSNKEGFVDKNTFLYKADGTYEHGQFGLYTSNQVADEFLDEEQKAEKTGENEFTFTSSTGYIGYTTDGGISDFPKDEGANAAGEYTIKTTKEGYVTAYTAKLDAALAMPIMNPAPLVKIDGTKSFSATYGETLDRLSTIDHEKTLAKVTFNELTTAQIEVFTSASFDMSNAKPVTSGSDVVVGEYLGLKVTPYGANTILRVTNNTVSLETPNSGDYFVFEVQEVVNNLGVNINGSEGETYATINVDVKDPTIEFSATYFKLINGQPDMSFGFRPVEENKIPVHKDNWLALQVKGTEGKEIVAINKDSGESLFPFGGQHCLNIKEEKTYNIELSYKGETPEEPEVVKEAKVIKATETHGATLTYLHFTFPNFGSMAPITEDFIEVGKTIAIKVDDEHKDSVVIKCNGQNSFPEDPAQAGGYWCFEAVKGNNTITVELK